MKTACFISLLSLGFITAQAAPVQETRDADIWQPEGQYSNGFPLQGVATTGGSEEEKREAVDIYIFHQTPIKDCQSPLPLVPLRLHCSFLLADCTPHAYTANLQH